MSIVNDLRTVMTNDPSINLMVNGGIYFKHLPEDFDITKNYIAYDFNISGGEICLNGVNAYNTYTISITITSTDSVVLNTISELLIDHLTGISTNNFVDIQLVSESKITTLAKPTNTYQTSQEWTTINLS